MGLGIKPTLRSTLENKSFQEKSLSKAAALKPASKSSLMKKGGKIIKKAQNGILGGIKKKASEIKAKYDAFNKRGDDDAAYTKKTFKTADSLKYANPKIGPKGLRGMLDEKASNRRKADSLVKTVEKRVGVPRDMNMYDNKNGGKIKKKAKNGTSFGMLSVKAGVDNNPSATFADKIAGAKKKAKFGKKMQYGGEAASMVPTMKKGGMKKKYKHGGTVSMQLGSYTRQIGKNYTGKATKAVGLTKAKYGTSMMKKGGKCKNGC